MTKASFFKPFLNFSEQAQLLIDRGLDTGTESGKKGLEGTLRLLNFFRFNRYCMRYYDNDSSHRFRHGTTFRRIWDDYLGDMKLRSVLFEAIQEVEISFRSQMVDVLASRHGIFPYEPEYYDCTISAWNDMYENHIHKAVRLSKEPDILEFLSRYKEPIPPIWMTVEVLSFGELSTLYNHYMNTADKKTLAERYMVPSIVLSSWLHSLSALRNKCAHHAKLIDTNSAIGVRFPRNMIRPGYQGLFITADPYSQYANIIALGYLTESMGQEGKAAAIFKRLMNIMSEFSIDISRLGFPREISFEIFQH